MRAESLRFRKQGVERVLKDVFIPWYNAYRFFIQNVKRYEAVSDTVPKVLMWTKIHILYSKNVNKN